MSTPYYTLLTTIGAAELVNAQAAGITVPFTHMAVGDGNGATPVHTETSPGLVHEVHRVPISNVTPDAGNPTWLIVEAVLPSAIGGWTAREIALIGGAGAGGKVLAVGTFPATYKPLLAEGSARDVVLRMIVEVGNASVVQLTVDPSVALATNQSIANAIAAHAAIRNHPDATKVAKGFTRLATVEEARTGTSETISVTPAGLAAVVASSAISAAEIYFMGQN